MPFRSNKFVIDYIQKHGVTHFLAIPLVTPTSRPVFRDSFKCLWHDLAALGVPTDAIRPLGLLHLVLGVPLSLQTPERMAKAKEILQNLSIKEVQPTIHESSISRNLPGQPTAVLRTSNDNTNNSMAPPNVSISSLFCRRGQEATSLNLSTIVYDPTHRVRNWKLRLAHTFQAAGLSPGPRHCRDSQTRAAMDESLGSCDATVRLMTMPKSTKPIPCRALPGIWKHPTLRPFDARSVLERYKEHVWIENIPLERVSICEIGFRRLRAKELPEVFSIPL